MVPYKQDWEEIVSNLGISNEDRIIIYDKSINGLLNNEENSNNLIRLDNEKVENMSNDKSRLEDKSKLSPNELDEEEEIWTNHEEDE